MSRPQDTLALPLGPVREIYTISRLNREARLLLEQGFPLLWVEGEISNLARPSSGHWYFSLKDDQAQVRCAMFRGRNAQAGVKPADGMHVVVRARVSLYENRGEFQLLVEYLEEAGEGRLRRRFEALKQRLHAEGLFDLRRKRPLPRLPRRIGVVTSPSGAAIRDILKVLARRFPAVPVLIYPVPVQGAGADRQIAAALHQASTRAECDVLILARGGGSLEDLWSFNEERVARAIYDCAIPVVSAIGHEVDFTIADFVADLRAPTPSGAAELVVPDRDEWLRRLQSLGLTLWRGFGRGSRGRAERLTQAGRRLERQHPGQRLRQYGQRLDELEQRLGRACDVALAARRARLAQFIAHLRRLSPLQRLSRLAERSGRFESRLAAAVRQFLAERRHRLTVASRSLQAVSPLGTLARGYALVSDAAGRLLRDAAEVADGAQIRTRLARGALIARVERREPE